MEGGQMGAPWEWNIQHHLKRSPVSPTVMTSDNHSFKKVSESLVKHLEREVTAIERERAELEAEQIAWALNADKLKHVQLPDKLKLDVGGKYFATSISTLKKVPNSFFDALVSGRWELNLDQDGCVFIDRDPSVFHLIMQYLRSYPKVPLDFDSLSQLERSHLQEDAEFYALESLTKRMRLSSSLDFSNNQIDQIFEWLPPYCSKEPKLLFRHPENAGQFYTKCGGKSRTLFLFEDTQGNLFGAYADPAWINGQGWINGGGKSFLFTLNNPNGIKPTKFICGATSNNELYAHPGSGPAFGAGHDLKIDPSGTSFQVNIGSTYQNKTGTSGDRILTGSSNGTLAKWEVWQV